MLAQVDGMGQPASWLWRRGEMTGWGWKGRCCELGCSWGRALKAGEPLQPWPGGELTLIRGTVERRVQDASGCLCLKDACE